MSNHSARPPAGPGLAPLLFAAGALVIYFLLISRWHGAPPTQSGESQSDARNSAPQLELSRRLSAPTGQAEASARGSRNAWLWPLAAFVPPLLIGMLWGNSRVSGTDEELVFGSSHQRAPDSDPHLASDSDVEDLFSPDVPTTMLDGDVDDAAATVTAAADDAGDAYLATEAAVADSASDPAVVSDEVAELRAALHARDEVIRTLEDIVKENRESWADRETSVDSQAQKITALQAELDAATRVIEMLHLSDGERDVAPRPQVLERS